MRWPGMGWCGRARETMRLLRTLDLETMGEDRLHAVYQDVAVLAAAEPPVLMTGTVAHQFCTDTVTRTTNLLESGAPLPSIVASIVMGSIRLGYAIRDDEIERDRAAVSALTGDES